MMKHLALALMLMGGLQSFVQMGSVQVILEDDAQLLIHSGAQRVLIPLNDAFVPQRVYLPDVKQQDGLVSCHIKRLDGEAIRLAFFFNKQRLLLRLQKPTGVVRMFVFHPLSGAWYEMAEASAWEFQQAERAYEHFQEKTNQALEQKLLRLKLL